VSKSLATFEELGMPKDVERALALKLALQGVAPGATTASIHVVAAEVSLERPDLSPHAAPDGTVTILFTDIEGSTSLNERVGDDKYVEILRSHNAAVRERVAANRGHEVKAQGDGFMVVFPSARRALRCAVEIQRAIESVGDDVRVRIGLHTGEAVADADDFFGTAVTTASRIADQASGGEILVSSLVRELTQSAGEFTFGSTRQVELKGLAGSHAVHCVAWST
jgi:class 3 adenylate cyclase